MYFLSTLVFDEDVQLTVRRALPALRDVSRAPFVVFQSPLPSRHCPRESVGHGRGVVVRPRHDLDSTRRDTRGSWGDARAIWSDCAKNYSTLIFENVEHPAD